MRYLLMSVAALLLGGCEIIPLVPQANVHLRAPVPSSMVLSGTIPAEVTAGAVVLVAGVPAEMDGAAWSVTIDLAPAQSTVDIELQIDGYTVARQELDLTMSRLE